MKLTYFSLLVLGSLLIFPSNASLVGQNLPVSGQQLFFDDFISSGFPSLWTTSRQLDINNSTQLNGYLSTIIQGGAIQVSPSGYALNLIANTTSPIIQAVENQSFTQIVFKMQAFNVTNPVITSQSAGGPPSNDYLAADIRFGLESAIPVNSATLPPNSIYFELVESTSQILNTCGVTAAKQAVYLSINGGPANGANSFHTCFPSAAIGTQDGMRYNGGGIDLNSMHIYTIQINKNITSASNEWVRYQVDSNAWETFSQTGCNCLGTTYNSANLYPFVTVSYMVSNYNAICPCKFQSSQSLASQIDYVLATNYVPSSLPQGQLLSSNINPPLHNLGIYQPGGFSLTQYVQFQANEIGQGNIYAGGLFLTGIFILIITLGLAGVIWKTKMGFSVFGVIWNISTLAFIYLMYYTGVIPLLIPVLVTIGAAAIMFGIFRSGPPSMGGEVQS